MLEARQSEQKSVPFFMEGYVPITGEAENVFHRAGFQIYGADYAVSHPQNTAVQVHSGGPIYQAIEGDMDVFKYFADVSQRPVVIIDQPGSGRSKLLDQGAEKYKKLWTLDQYVMWMYQIQSGVQLAAEAQGIPLNMEQAHWVGNSWGAMLGAVYANRHPSRVKSEVLIGPIRTPQDYTDDANIQLEAIFPGARAFIQECDASGAYDNPSYQAILTARERINENGLLLSMLPISRRDSEIEMARYRRLSAEEKKLESEKDKRKIHQHPFLPKAFRDSYEDYANNGHIVFEAMVGEGEFADTDATGNLQNFVLPVAEKKRLVIVGKHDTTTKRVADIIKSEAPEGLVNVVELPNSGHLGFWTERDDCFAAIDEHLRAVDAQAA